MLLFMFVVFGVVLAVWVSYNLGYCKGQNAAMYEDCFIKRVSFDLLDRERLTPKRPPVEI